MVTIMVSGSMVMSSTLPSVSSTLPAWDRTSFTRTGAALLPLPTFLMVITAGTTFRKISPWAVALITAEAAL